MLIKTESTISLRKFTFKGNHMDIFKDAEIHTPINIPREDLQSAFGGPMKL